MLTDDEKPSRGYGPPAQGFDAVQYVHREVEESRCVNPDYSLHRFLGLSRIRSAGFSGERLGCGWYCLPRHHTSVTRAWESWTLGGKRQKGLSQNPQFLFHSEHWANDRDESERQTQNRIFITVDLHLSSAQPQPFQRERDRGEEMDWPTCLRSHRGF